MIVKCRYCGNTMTESDKVCPSCGAPNEEMAEYFKKQAEHRREQELLREKARLAEAQQKKKQVNKYAAAPKQKNKKTNLGCLIPIILFAPIILFVIAVGFSVTIQYKDERESKKAEIAAEQEALALEQTMVYANKGEWCEKSGYHVMVDDARTYEFFTDHNDSSYKISEHVANDESRIAVHIVFENTSDKSLRVTPAVSVTDENKLQAEAIRFNAYTAFGDYRLDDDDTDFEGHELESYYEVLSGNRIEGWRFFIVNTKSKTLTVRYGDYSEITIDNPAYKEN